MPQNRHMTGEGPDPCPLVVAAEQVEAALAGPLPWIVNATPVVVWTVDTELVLRSTTGGWLLSRGMRPADRVGRPVAEVWPDRPDLVEHARRAAVDGVGHRADLEVGGRVLDTRIHPLRIAGAPDGSPPAGAVGLGIDVTAERRSSRRVAAFALFADEQAAAGDDALAIVAALAHAAARYAGAAAVVCLRSSGGGDHVVAATPAGPVPDRLLPVAVALAGDPQDRGAATALWAACGMDGADPVVVRWWPLEASSTRLGTLHLVTGAAAAAHEDPMDASFVDQLVSRAALHLVAVQARIAAREQRERRARRATYLEILADVSRRAQISDGFAADHLEELLGRVGGAVQAEVRLVLAAGEDAEPAGGQAAEPGGAALLRIPLGVEGECGTLLASRPRPFDTDEEAFLRDLADRASLAARSRRLTEERDQAMRDLADSESRFRSAFGDAPFGMFLGCMEPGRMGEVLDANAAMARMLGYPPEGLIGMSFRELVHPDDIAVDAELLAQVASGRRQQYQREKRYLRSDGSVIWVRVSGTLVLHDGKPAYVIGHVEDVTDRRAAEEELAHRALYDPLTGLPNRHLALDHLTLALKALPRRPGRVAVLYADLDRFKAINDTFGHEAGDHVLSVVASRLASVVRSEDTPTRLGGDEFVVICRDVGSDDDLKRLARRVVAALDAPIPVTGGSAHVGVSLGIAATADPATPPEQLMREADTAMYEAKRRGRHRFELYQESLGQQAVRRLRVEADLRQALDGGGLRLHYQPVVDLTTGRIVAAEALLRVQHPERGLLAPVDFIDVAEESALMQPLGAWVLEEACRQLAAWRRLLPGADAAFGLAVNVSSRQAADATMSVAVLRAAAQAGVDPGDICLEMTERTLLHAAESVVEDLHALTRSGVRLAIDDFGTGYSSLTYLQRLPVDTVKIDRSFVAGLGQNPRDSAIVGAVAALGTALDLTVVAEGVEHPGQADALRAMGCRLAQGYHFGRPLPAEELTALLLS